MVKFELLLITQKARYTVVLTFMTAEAGDAHATGLYRFQRP